MNKNILFMMRAYNDIDHITPIIYKLNKDQPSVIITIFIYDVNETYEHDYRIQFLKTLSVNIIHVLDYIETQVFPINTYKKLIHITKNLSRFNPIRVFISRLFIIPFRKLLTKKISDLEPDEFLQTILREIPSIIVFDQGNNRFYKKLCKFSAKHGIVTVAVPHGHNTFANEMIWTNSMEISQHTSEIQFVFYYQYVVFENWIIAERYKKMGLVKEKQIRVLGSSRFSDEWINKLNEILSKSTLPEYPPKILRVVFFLTKRQYNINQSEIERSINFLSKFPDIYIIIKPHTRGKFNMSLPTNVEIVDNECHSPWLIDWADIVLFTMSSVIFDCLKKDVPTIYMKNTHSNKLLSENYFNSWEVHCRDDLRDFIWRYKNNRNTRTYLGEDRDKYCKEMLEPEGKDVLGNYVSFLKELLP